MEVAKRALRVSTALSLLLAACRDSVRQISGEAIATADNDRSRLQEEYFGSFSLAEVTPASLEAKIEAQTGLPAVAGWPDRDQLLEMMAEKPETNLVLAPLDITPKDGLAKKVIAGCLKPQGKDAECSLFDVSRVQQSIPWVEEATGEERVEWNIPEAGIEKGKLVPSQDPVDALNFTLKSQNGGVVLPLEVEGVRITQNYDTVEADLGAAAPTATPEQNKGKLHQWVEKFLVWSNLSAIPVQAAALEPSKTPPPTAVIEKPKPTSTTQLTATENPGWYMNEQGYKVFTWEGLNKSYEFPTEEQMQALIASPAVQEQIAKDGELGVGPRKGDSIWRLSYRQVRGASWDEPFFMEHPKVPGELLLVKPIVTITGDRPVLLLMNLGIPNKTFLSLYASESCVIRNLFAGWMERPEEDWFEENLKAKDIVWSFKVGVDGVTKAHEYYRSYLQGKGNPYNMASSEEVAEAIDINFEEETRALLESLNAGIYPERGIVFVGVIPQQINTCLGPKPQ